MADFMEGLDTHSDRPIRINLRIVELKKAPDEVIE
jgi:hypothetical protein